MAVGSMAEAGIRAILRDWRQRFRRRRRLRRHLRHFSTCRVDIAYCDRGWRVAEFRKDWRGVKLLLGSRARDQELLDKIYRHRLPVAVHLLSRTLPTVVRALANVGDHDSSTDPKTLTFSSIQANALLIPDPDFFNGHGYEKFRRQLANQRPWRERGDMIVWRGATTGVGRFPDDSLDVTATDVRPHIRMCGLLKPMAGIDAKLYTVVESKDGDGDQQSLARAGLLGNPVPAESWLDGRLAVDIDGNTNAWSNLFTRLLFGCCVIKVASPGSYRQWYYHRLEPWKTHVPVRADLADLTEKVEWCRAHSAECAEIAATGQALALTMTAESEIKDAIERINQRLDRK